MKPRRIQLSRKKGWRKPLNTVVVSRPSRWGNYVATVRDVGSHYKAMLAFKAWLSLSSDERYRAMIKCHLQGKNLACWCPLDKPCHADVLLEFVNGGKR